MSRTKPIRTQERHTVSLHTTPLMRKPGKWRQWLVVTTVGQKWHFKGETWTYNTCDRIEYIQRNVRIFELSNNSFIRFSERDWYSIYNSSEIETVCRHYNKVQYLNKIIFFSNLRVYSGASLGRWHKIGVWHLSSANEYFWSRKRTIISLSKFWKLMPCLRKPLILKITTLL